MSASYFLEEMSKRWNWGNLSQEIVDTRCADILNDWRLVTKTDADAAVQLLRRGEYHKGNFMPTADAIERAVHGVRAHRNVGKPTTTGTWTPADKKGGHIGLYQFVAEYTGQAWQAAVRAKCGSLEAWHKAPYSAGSGGLSQDCEGNVAPRGDGCLARQIRRPTPCANV